MIFHSASSEEIVTELNTHIEQGLSPQQVEEGIPVKGGI